MAQFDYDWPAHSALSEGQWFRIATTKTGFHKVDVALLNALGLGSRLGQSRPSTCMAMVATPCPWTMPSPARLTSVPVPIEMVDDGDGQFDGADHFVFLGDGPEGMVHQ